MVGSRRFHVEGVYGVSEVIAVFIVIGIVIVLSIAFINLLQSMYQSTRRVQLIEELIRAESLNTIVRYMGVVDDYALFLLKKLDSTQAVSFIIYSGGEYRDCSIIEKITDGELIGVDRLDLSSIKIISNGFMYDFGTYARTRGLLDRGYAWICSLRLRRNTVISLKITWPIVKGLDIVEVNSTNRSWGLRGVMEFKLINDTRLYIGNNEYRIPRGSIIGIYVNSTTGMITTHPVERGILIEELRLRYDEVFLNYTSLHKNGVLRVSNILIDREHVKTNLILDIQPIPSDIGAVVVKYGNQVLVDTNDPVYIRIRSWIIGANTSLRIIMDNRSLNARGFAYAVYKSESPYFALNELMIITVIYVDNVPYVVDIYKYDVKT